MLVDAKWNLKCWVLTKQEKQLFPNSGLRAYSRKVSRRRFKHSVGRADQIISFKPAMDFGVETVALGAQPLRCSIPDYFPVRDLTSKNPGLV